MLRPTLLLAALAALATLARDAAACVTSAPMAIRFWAAPAAHTPVPTDGVIAIAVDYVPSLVPVDLGGITVTLDAGDAPLDVELVLHDIGGQPVPGVMSTRPAILVVHPLAPLAPLTAHHLRVDPGDLGDLGGDVFELDFESGAGPRALPPVLIADASLTTGDPEVLDRACCETSRTSCGGGYFCTETELRHRPAASLGASIAPGDQLHAVPWVSPLDAGDAPIDRRYPSSAFWQIAAELDVLDDPWAVAGDTFHLEAGAGTRCFASGLLDLVSGAESIGEPFCVDTDHDPLPAAELETREPDAPDWSFLECLGPWISERDGAAPEATGCRVADPQAPLSPLALLPLLALARRRASSRPASRRPARA